MDKNVEIFMFVGIIAVLVLLTIRADKTDKILNNMCADHTNRVMIKCSS